MCHSVNSLFVPKGYDLLASGADQFGQRVSSRSVMWSH